MIIDNNMIGRGLHDYIGAGMNWEHAEKWMEHDTTIQENDEIPRIFEIVDRKKIEDAQAVLIIHGVGRGTGCGAAPVIARFLKEQFPMKAIFTLTVLPFRDEIGGGHADNGIAGFTKIVESADVVMAISNRILFDRLQQYERGLRSVEDIKGEINSVLVKLIELLIVSFISDFYSLVDHDLNDIVELLKKHGDEVNGKNAGIIAAFIGKTLSGDLFFLLVTLPEEGMLAECDLRTAKGAIFLFVGPSQKIEEIMNDTNKKKEDSIFFKTVQRDILYPNAPLYPWYVEMPALKELYLLALLFNPEIEDLNIMLERAENEEIKAKAKLILNYQGMGGI
jgi:cell division GTPase FtsZ